MDATDVSALFASNTKVNRGTEAHTYHTSQAIVWGQQLKAVQGMLDFDYVCRRERPSVVASTYPLSGDHKQKFYFGHKEILIPGM